MNRRNSILILSMGILWHLVFSISLMAQKPNYKFKSIKESDGLINSTVQAIFEDSFGFIWLGTHHGLQRFDGNTYTNYVKSDDSIGLSHNYINDFCEDSAGNIWIATNLGLNIYLRETDEIITYQWKGKYREQLKQLPANKILKDKNNADLIWITALDIGLIKLNIQTDSVTIFSIPQGNFNWIQGMVHHPQNENKLLLGGYGIYVFDINSGQFEILFSLEQNNSVSDNRINDFVLDPSDSNILWCATGDIWGRGSLGGLLRFNLETLESELLSKKTRAGDIPDNHILQVCFYEKNKLWVGTRNHGVLLYDLEEDLIYNYRYNEYNEGSFVTENAIRSMLLDRSGTMWYGTWGDGISILSPAFQKFTHYKHLPGAAKSLVGNYITGISEDKDGNIWIGTKANGLSKFDPIHKTFESHLEEFASTDHQATEITYVFYDSHGYLWVGTYDNALYRYHPETREKIHYQKGSKPKEVSQKRITAITELIPGEILISTYGGGLNIYDYKMDYFQKYVNNPNDSTSIPDNQIWLPFLGEDGNYYFGGNSTAGLIQFNPKTQKFKQPLTDQPFTTYIDASQSSNGDIYIDAVSIGLTQVVLGDTISITALSDTAGNNIRNVECIAIDNDNRLWMGTGNGLVRYDPDARNYTRYDMGDGLQDYRFNRFCGFKSSTGDLYFGGKNGINIFHPDDIKLSNYKPPIVFTEFKLFQEKVTIGESSPLKSSILVTQEIHLEHHENDFSVAFAALDYSNPQKIKYKYKLVNHDMDWVHSNNLGLANYTNMSPGNYTFQVLSTNADGIWNDQLQSLKMIIYPPWWKTNLAYIFYILMFILGVFIVDRYQRKRLQERERALTREKELEQAKEIEKAYKELQNTQKQLVHSEKMASLGELTAGIAHEIQNPLNFINNFSEVNIELIEEMKEEINKGDFEEVKAIAMDITGNEEKIMQHGKRADSIVKGMLQHSRSSNGMKEATDINSLADEYLRLAYHGLRAKDKSFNAKMITDFDEKVGSIMVVPQDIGRVILNLITNAFYACTERSRSASERSRSASIHANADQKFEPTIWLSTQKKNDKVYISVSDNGKGIPQDLLEKIFQPFFTTKPTGEGTGLGLSMSYDIITKGHKGDLKIQTKDGNKYPSDEAITEFIIELPILN